MLLDVASVPRGRNCNCICPSCKTPLVARQGQVKEWHFAHQSRGVHAETRNECDYSFEMSVRLMLRQLSSKGLRFKTPEFKDSISALSDVSYQSHVIDFTVTVTSIIQLEDPIIGSFFSGVEVDVLGDVKGIPFVIYVTYEGREIPDTLRAPKTSRCGVVEVNLAGVASRFRQEKYGRYIEALKTYIEQSTEGKHWVYHPRYLAAHQKAKSEMEVWLEQQKELNHYRTGLDRDDIVVGISGSCNCPTPQHSAKRYKCLVCDSRWSGMSLQCTRCNTHLHTAEDIYHADEA